MATLKAETSTLVKFKYEQTRAIQTQWKPGTEQQELFHISSLSPMLPAFPSKLYTASSLVTLTGMAVGEATGSSLTTDLGSV